MLINIPRVFRDAGTRQYFGMGMYTWFTYVYYSLSAIDLHRIIFVL
jgi:hypothetical protein